MPYIKGIIAGLSLDILKMESWTHMGRTANIIIKDVIHIFASISKIMRILLMGRRNRERCNSISITPLHGNQFIPFQWIPQLVSVPAIFGYQHLQPTFSSAIPFYSGMPGYHMSVFTAICVRKWILQRSCVQPTGSSGLLSLPWGWYDMEVLSTSLAIWDNW